MKYQDFASDEHLASSEDIVLIFHMLRYRACHDYRSLNHSKICHHRLVASENKMEFSNQLLPNDNINIFNDEQNERIDGSFVPMIDGEVDYLIETRENAKISPKSLSWYLSD